MIPETGTVIKVDKDMAMVLLNAGKSCKGCGAAKIGLCKPSGNVSILNVRNTVDAVVGDSVRVGLDKGTQMRGFLFAYIIPLICFIGGSILGYTISKEFSIPSFEVITGFSSLLFASIYSFRKLKKLDNSSLMTIKQIVSEEYPVNGFNHTQLMQ